jgi:hypothetical protein
MHHYDKYMYHTEKSMYYYNKYVYHMEKCWQHGSPMDQYGMDQSGSPMYAPQGRETDSES